MKGQLGEWNVKPVVLAFSFYMNTRLTSNVESSALRVVGGSCKTAESSRVAHRNGEFEGDSL